MAFVCTAVLEPSRTASSARAWLPAHLVELHASPDQVLAANRVAGEGGEDIVRGEGVRHNPDPDAAGDQFFLLSTPGVKGMK